MIRRAPRLHLGQLPKLLAGAADVSTDGSGASYAGYTRFALANLFKLLGYGAGDRILLPAYICDVVLLPFAELGIEPVYYAVTGDFQIDWESVTVPAGTRAIITVNYFGVSQEYAAIRAFADRHGLLWINDNAHGFASSLGEKKLEEYGDVSFTSFRKTIPSLNGARILFNSDRCRSLKEPLDRLNAGGNSQPRPRYFLGALLASLGLRLRSLPDFSDMTAFSDTDLAKYQIDPLSLRLLFSCDEAAIRERRRALYQKIEHYLVGSGTRCIATIPGLLRENNAPLVLPVVAESPDAWFAVLKTSREAGFDLHTWPSLPAQVLHDNSCNALSTWRRMLYLPLHQDLESADYLAQLQRVLNAV